MIKDTQEYLQHWEKENNPFYPSEMRWDRLQVNRFLKDYKKQLTLTDVGNCPFEAYAVFCIECDRKGIKPIKHKDYLNLG